MTRKLTLAAVAAATLMASTLGASAQQYVYPGDTSSSGNVGPGTSNNGSYYPPAYYPPGAVDDGPVVVAPGAGYVDGPATVIVEPGMTFGYSSGGGSRATTRGGANGTAYGPVRTTTGPLGDASQAESPAK